MESKLDQIFIRAKDHTGKWGSFSLKELHDMGMGSHALKWVLEHLIGLNDGANVSLETLDRAVELLPEGSYVALNKRENVQ